MEIIIITLMIMLCIQASRRVKDAFKIGYYETKLENRGVDIDHVKNISYREIFFR